MSEFAQYKPLDQTGEPGAMRGGGAPLQRDNNRPISSRGLAIEEADPIQNPSEVARGGVSYYRKKWAIIVGIDKYSGNDPDLRNLLNAENDAREFRTLLQDEFGYAQAETLYIVNEAATLRNIQSAFHNWLPKNDVASEDSLLFFFAGHGLIDRRNQGWLAVADSHSKESAIEETCLSVEWLRDQIGSLPCKHKLIVLDSCYSGALFLNDTDNSNQTVAKAQGFGSTRGTSIKTTVAPLKDNLQVLSRAPAFLGISAGRSKEVVADGLGTKRHSVFTSALLDVLRERANTNRADSIFTFRTAAAQVADQVVNALGSAQIPEYGRLGTGDGDFIFAPTVKRLTPREQARRSEYARALAKCQQEISANNLGEAIALLEACPNDLRGWEWYHLKTATSPETLVLRLPSLSLAGFAMDADSELIAASETTYNNVYLWNTSGTLLEACSVERPVHKLAFHPKTRQMALGMSRWSTIKCMGASPTGFGEISTLIKDTGHPDTVEDIAYASDGENLLTGTQSGGLNTWSAKTGALVRKYKGHNDAVLRLRITPDGKHFLTASADHTARMYSFANDQPVQEFSAHNDKVWDISIIPNKKVVATVSLDQSICVFELETGQLLKKIEEPSGIAAITFSKDGHLAATGSYDNRIRIYDTDTWAIRRTLVGHRNSVTALIADNNPSCFWSASLDGSIRKWEWTVSPEIAVERVKDAYLEDIEANSNGFVATTDAEGHIRIKIASGWHLVHGHKRSASLAFHPSRAIVATASLDGSLRLWNAVDGSLIRELCSGESQLMHVTFDTLGQRIATIDFDGEVCIRDVNTGKVLLRKTVGDNLGLSGCFVGDGKYFVGATIQGQIILFDSATGETSASVTFSDRITAMSSLHDGRAIAIGGSGGRICLLDSATLKTIWSTDGHSQTVRGLCFSIDGSRLFSTSDDQTIRVWQAEFGQALLTMISPGVACTDLCFSRDNCLFSCSSRGDIYEWRSPASTLNEHARKTTINIGKERFSIEALYGLTALVEVVGDTKGEVYGSGIYGPNSNIYTAAVHAGLVSDGHKTVVRLIFTEPPRGAFRGSLSNGVQSLSGDPYADKSVGSFAFKLESVQGHYSPEEIKTDSRFVGPILEIINSKMTNTAALSNTASDTKQHKALKAVRVKVVGTVNGEVWGDGPYTADSDVNTAAVHSGLVKSGHTGTVVLTWIEPPDRFKGSQAFGVSTRPFGRFPQSFVLSIDDESIGERIYDAGMAASTAPVLALDSSLKSFRVEVVGEKKGVVWGSGPYTADSSIAAAAVHAGLVKLGQRKVVVVKLLDYFGEYAASAANGVTTRGYHDFPRAFSLVKDDSSVGDRIYTVDEMRSGEISGY